MAKLGGFFDFWRNILTGKFSCKNPDTMWINYLFMSRHICIQTGSGNLQYIERKGKPMQQITLKLKHSILELVEGTNHRKSRQKLGCPAEKILEIGVFFLLSPPPTARVAPAQWSIPSSLPSPPACFQSIPACRSCWILMILDQWMDFWGKTRWTHVETMEKHG